MTKTNATNRVRIDDLVVTLGHAPTREKAAAMVMSGVVLANERRIEKPSEIVDAASLIRIKGDVAVRRYASRGGLKLEHALKEFSIDPTDFRCIDIGSSTGGFTDCLLQHGAASVVAIDAGTNQLDWSLRTDPRVEVRENTNARDLTSDNFATKFDLATIDVSFISLTKILGAVLPLLKPGGQIVALIKPQFEVARHEVGDGGIVRDESLHARVIKNINDFALSLGLSVIGNVDSPILGMEGNKEFLALYGR